MTSQTIDLTPTWQGVLRLLLTAYEDGSAKGRGNALEELVRMAQLADLYVVSQKDKPAVRPVLNSDTRRVEAALEWLDHYNRELDRMELSPNGDDFNELTMGMMSILQDGVERSLILKAEGR